MINVQQIQMNTLDLHSHLNHRIQDPKVKFSIFSHCEDRLFGVKVKVEGVIKSTVVQNLWVSVLLSPRH